MTFEELLQAAGLAGGTAPDPSGSDPGYRPPTPSLGLGTDAMTGYPRALGGAPMEPAVEHGLRLPGPGGVPDHPGGSSFFERLATVGGLPHVPFYGGENGSTRSHPALALLALASGALNARAKLAGADKLERLQFADRQDQQVAARKTERDATFARARTLAETVRKEKAEREAKRVDQMTTARRDYEGKLDAWMHIINTSTTQEQLDDAKRQANKYQGLIENIDRDMSNLTGQQKLAAAGVDTSAGIPGMPSHPPKPPKESTGGEGGYATFKMPDGTPKYMRQAEGARLGLVPTNTRETRVPAPAEKEQMTGDIGLLTEVNFARGKFKPDYVGPGKDKVGKGQELFGLMSKEESAFRSSMQAIINNIANLRSGKAVTPQEAERLMKELPTFDLPPKAWKSRMAGFERYFRTLAKTRREMIGAFGVDLTGAPELPAEWVEPTDTTATARPDASMPPDSVAIITPKGERRMVSRAKLAEAIRRGAKEAP